MIARQAAPSYRPQTLSTPAGWRNYHRSALLIRLVLIGEVQGRRIHAEAQSGRIRTVVENVPQMRAATTAHHLGPPHPVTRIDVLGNPAFFQRRIEARPSASRVILGVGGK